jgi:NAD(P)-dependent dehydrogenase (short-subunit alcohol dehydrogenase family)
MKRSERILITGATGNIGGAIARGLAGNGSRIALACRSNVHAAHLLGDELVELGSEAHILSEDISTASGAHKLIADTVGLLGGIDLLVHCASTIKKVPFERVDETTWDEAISTNLGATFFLVQAAVKAMDDDGGKIILFSDVAAIRPYGDYLPYCISKAGIEALVRGLAKRVAPKITINAIAPFIVTRPTDMSETEWDALVEKTPMKRSSTPKEIGDIVYALANSDTITGEVITVDGGRSLV